MFGEEYTNNKYNELHDLYTDRVKDMVYSMRGFYLKNCQLMSTQDDFVPPQYMKWLKDTQDNVPSDFRSNAEAKEYTRQMLLEEQGLQFDVVFSSWEDEPIGVASIGQVHRATLRRSGQIVAVKILCPGMETKFRSDIRTLKSFCQLAMPQHVSAFAEIEKQFCTEFDYTKEAENLNIICEAIMPKWNHAVAIPKPHMELCSRHVLVMEHLDGVKLVDGIRRQYRKLAALQGKTLEDLEAERRRYIEEGKFKFKSLDETRADSVSTAWWLYLNDLLLSPDNNILRFAYNCSVLRWWYGPCQYKRTEVPVDLGHILELLGRVHGCQIFEHGRFNGDPHPGNILLLSDGRLGLIDYGQVKTLSFQNRVKYAKLIVAHSRGDKKEIIRLHFDELGTVTRKRDPEVGYLMSCFYNDRDTDDVCGGRNIVSFVDWMERKDPMVHLPEDFVFASRVSIMLRGMGKAFGLQLRMSQLWEPEATAFLKAHDIEY